jgi:hypothetical protein
MKPPGFSKKIVFFTIAVSLLSIGAFPANTISGYEAENCEMGCRVVFDPVLNATDYANCVEQCKRYLMNKPQL